MSAIRNFYKQKNILVTGGTGFVGLSIVEKLLRSFPEIGNIYMIVRPLKGLSLAQRKEDFIRNPIFERIHKEKKADFSKVVWIEGDLVKPNLGLTKPTIKNLQESVNLIIHSAATINFMEPLKQAITINVSATNDLLKIATACKNLQCFVYISTLFSQAKEGVKYIDELIGAHPIDPTELIRIGNRCTFTELNDKTKEIIQDWPNTYTYTKNAAENLVADCKAFPAIVYRPGAVMPSYEEPSPYWIGNNMALARVMMESHRGLVYEEDPNVNANAVPVDLMVNGILMAAFDSSINKDFKVYNYSTNSNPYTVVEFFQQYVSRINDYESVLVPKRKELLKMENVKPDSKEALMIQKVHRYNQMHKSLQYFLNLSFECSNANIDKLSDQMDDEQRKLLTFDLRDIDWQKFYSNMYGRTHGTTQISFDL